MNNRIVSIDILKVFATILVLNSHMEVCYHPYEFLATGGAIGDALFFFCSGFTLLLGRQTSFPNFYKRRISRIFPSLFVVAFWVELRTGTMHSLVFLLFSGGWFVSCILIYYIPLYFVKRYGLQRLKAGFVCAFLANIICYYAFFDNQNAFSLYGENYYKWCFFFLFMLLGGIVGYYHEKIHSKKCDILKLLGCIVGWYSFSFISRYSSFLIEYQYLSLILLLGVTYYFYKMCCMSFWKELYKHKIIGVVLFVVGSICLESYLIQGSLFTDELNHIFPMNIPIIMLYVLTISYIVKVFANIFSQTFMDENYNYKKIFLLTK